MSQNRNYIFTICLVFSEFVIHYFTIAYIIIYNFFRNSESICMSTNPHFLIYNMYIHLLCMQEKYFSECNLIGIISLDCDQK